MAKISMEIALAGGAEIEKQLADIGEAGQKAFLDISKAAEQAGGFKNLKPEEVTKKLQDMGVTGVDALKKIQAAVQSAARLESLVQGVQKAESAFAALATGALGFGAAVVAVAAVVIPYLQSIATEINKISDQAVGLDLVVQKFDALRLSITAAGISAEGFSTAMAAVKAGLDSAALKRIADDFNILKTGVGNTEAAFKDLRTAATQFTPEGKAAAEALLKLGQPVPGMGEGVVTLDNLGKTAGFTKQNVQDLGIELAKLKGLTGVDFKPSDDAITRFNKIVEALTKIPDAGQRAQAALEFLGKAGPEFERAFQTGALEKFKQDIAGMSEQAAKTAAEMEQSHQRILAAWSRLDISAALSEMNQYAAASNSVAWERISSIGVPAWDALTGAIQTAIDKLKEFLALKPSGGGPAFGTTGGGGGGGGFASGGLLGGRGSGTSDSNLAWVSRGEYIVPARAVAQPGVLSLLETLRRGMGHFALGGMVGPVGIPAFAGGGMNHVSINFPGLPEINGLRAPSGVVDELRKAAAMAQVRSGGRKPSRFS
jgi:hypothetical protein